MARIEKTVFISYRRTDVYTALAVYENLKSQGYDVFFDYRSISSGDFEQIITSNIRARAHFLLILTPGALDRCKEPGDWLRREIEIAIGERRNIVPLFFRGFHFGDPAVAEKLTGLLGSLNRYNGLNVHEDYFDEAMHRLRMQYLNKPLDTVLHPVSNTVQKIVREEQVAADKALEQINDVHELVKGPEGRFTAPNQQLDLKHVEIPKEERREEKKIEKLPVLKSRNRPEERLSLPYPKLRLFMYVVGGLLLTTLCTMGTVSYFSNILFDRLITVTPTATTPTPAMPRSATSTRTAIAIDTPTSKPITPTVPPTPAFTIGSIKIGRDGMTLLYVPAGEFTMGGKAEDSLAECQKHQSDCQLDWFKNAEPPHTVSLDAFWIDQTEVTNKMYATCVDAVVCKEPTNTSSYTHSSYYRNAEYDNYPVVNVDWYMAKVYCEWANRRLPTEAEWEKAARGPNGNIYPWGNTFDGTFVNFCDINCQFDRANRSYNDGYADVSPVGSYTSGKSIYGALDMAGNVTEWVSSLYQMYPYNATDGREDPSSSNDRVLRGGTWFNISANVRSYDRSNVGHPPSFIGDGGVGFRCAMSAIP